MMNVEVNDKNGEFLSTFLINIVDPELKIFTNWVKLKCSCGDEYIYHHKLADYEFGHEDKICPCQDDTPNLYREAGHLIVKRRPINFLKSIYFIDLLKVCELLVKMGGGELGVYIYGPEVKGEDVCEIEDLPREFLILAVAQVLKISTNNKV